MPNFVTKFKEVKASKVPAEVMCVKLLMNGRLMEKAAL